MSVTKTSPAAAVVDRYIALRDEMEAQARRYDAAATQVGGCTLEDTAAAIASMDELAHGLARLGEMALNAVADETDLRLWLRDGA
jgi:hypothetical protein